MSVPRLSIDSKEPLLFILDTGTSKTQLCERDAEKIGISLERDLKYKEESFGIDSVSSVYYVDGEVVLTMPVTDGSVVTFRFDKGEMLVSKCEVNDESKREIIRNRSMSLIGVDVLGKGYFFYSPKDVAFQTENQDIEIQTRFNGSNND